MNNHLEAESLRELQSLVDRLLDEQLSSADCQRLEELICSNQACSDYYVQAMQLTAGLARGAMPPLRLGQLQSENTTDLQAEVATLSAQVEALAEITLTQTPATTSETAAPQGSGKQSSGSPPVFPAVGDPTGDSAWIQFPKSFALFGLAMLVVGAFGGWLVTRSASPIDADRSIARNNNSSAAAPAITPAAYVTMANGCNWGGSTPEVWAVGRSVQLGDEITLHEGIAEFRLASGVSLSIEGPAALVLTSSTSLAIQHGRLTAHVPWNVPDFKALASTCRITACDAEFGVHVAGSEVDIHAFSGEVFVGPSPFEEPANRGWEQGPEQSDLVQQEEELPSGANFVKAAVAPGRAISLFGDGGMMKVSRWHEAKDDEFATKLPMAGLLPISQKYVDSVLASQPLGYWRFESLHDGVVDEVSSRVELRIRGDVRLSGDASNRVAEFGRTSLDTYLISDQPLDALAATDYSAEFWMKPSHYHQSGVLALVDDPLSRNGRHGFLIELQPALNNPKLAGPCSIRFLHRDPPGSDRNTGTSCYSSAPYRLRRWQHVVAVKEGSQMRLYHDGQLAAASDDPTQLSTRLQLVLGQLIGKHRDLPFIGQLDELAVYDRALTVQEITRHFRAVRWKSASGKHLRDSDI